MKRILTLMIALAAILPGMAQGFTYIYKGVEFKGKINKGEACIKSFDNKAPDVTIPASVSHKGTSYPVKSVSVFMNGVNYSTVRLTLEEGIEDIDKFCFNEFRKLTSVSLPASLRHIGKNAFRDNSGMTLNMLSSIDETSLRKGYELHPDGSGSMMAYTPASAAPRQKQQKNDNKKQEEVMMASYADQLEKEVEKHTKFINQQLQAINVSSNNGLRIELEKLQNQETLDIAQAERDYENVERKIAVAVIHEKYNEDRQRLLQQNGLLTQTDNYIVPSTDNNGDTGFGKAMKEMLGLKRGKKNKKDKQNETDALKEKLKEQERLLKQQQELLAQAEKNNQKAAADNDDDSEGGISGAVKGMFGFRNKKKNKKNKTENNTAVPAPAPTQQQPLLATATEAVTPAAPQLPPVDVDIDIPVVKTDKNANTYCIIIANEKYEDVPEVEFAERDGNIFREYCVKTLGIPEKQVRSFINASYTDIKRALNWIETMADISGGNSKVLFYYAGHGIPNEKDKTAYLIPTDGFPKDITTCFKLSDLYARLGKIKTQSVTVLLDACFSGVKRGTGQALVAARGVAIKPKNEVLSGNMVVFTAASDDETALSYKDKRHGMFTYFLLDKLKKSQGNASFGEIFNTLSTEVKKNSMLENDNLQTPSVNVSTSMKPRWEKMQF